MADNTLQVSNIFLTIVCAFILVASFVFNFTFLVTLLKLRRLNRLDKSNYLLTNLIVADFFCAFFILVPSAFGVYNSEQLEFSGCKVQTFFTTFFLATHFSGLLILSIERYVRYQFPIWHINTFTKRLTYDENDNLVGDSLGFKTLLFIGAVWLVNIFISFIPFFGNYQDVQYFAIESQCDYIYERFTWWLWLFFWLCLTIPFLTSIVFFLLTLKLIFKSERMVRIKRTNYDLDQHGRRRSAANQVETIIEGVDITRQPCNRFYYEHVVNPDEGEGEGETIYNDFHVRNQLLAQYKYETEKSKTITFFVITILSYMIIFPVFVIHFTRTYRNGNATSTVYDNPDTVNRGVYTAFVWISYSLLVIKSLVCLAQNRFYRHALYQSANCKGFSGIYDFQHEFKQIIRRIDSVVEKKKFTQSDE
jgi:hypothetical protein